MGDYCGYTKFFMVTNLLNSQSEVDSEIVQNWLIINEDEHLMWSSTTKTAENIEKLWERSFKQ